MTRRYSLGALIDASGLSEHALSQRVGLTGTPLIRARRNGLIESAADKYACRLGLVPWLVWSDWLDDAAVECADPSCSNRFVPSRKGHRFCSPPCRWRANRVRKAARWATDADHRARRAAYMRQYRADAKATLAAQKRRWCDENRERVRAMNRRSTQAWRERRKTQGKAA